MLKISCGDVAGQLALDPITQVADWLAFAVGVGLPSSSPNARVNDNTKTAKSGPTRSTERATARVRRPAFALATSSSSPKNDFWNKDLNRKPNSD